MSKASAQRRAEHTGGDSNEKFEGTDAQRQPARKRQHRRRTARDGGDLQGKRRGGRDRAHRQSGRARLHACGACGKLGKCVFDDVVNELKPKFEEADGLVVASPVYYASANATLVACLDRLFYISSFDKTMKVGASVVCARRGGCSATFDELNKYFTISGMPVASSQYWNSIHGRAPGEAEQDGEGRQTMRTLARNMTFLMKSIALGKEQFGLPEKEERIATHFIR